MQHILSQPQAWRTIILAMRLTLALFDRHEYSLSGPFFKDIISRRVLMRNYVQVGDRVASAHCRIVLQFPHGTIMVFMFMTSLNKPQCVDCSTAADTVRFYSNNPVSCVDTPLIAVWAEIVKLTISRILEIELNGPSSVITTQPFTLTAYPTPMLTNSPQKRHSKKKFSGFLPTVITVHHSS